ncbi:uncharacterized protein [Euphorbia lathyris]|uniref:uncharacterized protein n=1 Tax=Euphorbia lathyris TaxID=212925 RepID=UPI003313B689
MEGERKRSKGSFFHLFDWNAKSRKRLFAKDPEFPEGTEQRKENIECVPKLIELDDRRANSSKRGSSEFSCTSSVTSDDGFGSRAPGVVARLMGLDSLPTSSVAEPSSIPFSGSLSLRESQYDKSTPTIWSEYNPMEYIGDISTNQEGVSWNSSESRRHKVQNRPIERFQNEMLPPKSAKSIPITHHKLLSPIKNPGFIPRKNTAYIMEASAKIIEASPKETISGRVPSISSSSVPLRIRDLKQKMEAANTASRPQRPNEPIAAKNRKGQVSDRWQNGSEGISSSRASMLTEKATSDSFRNKGKSVSLTVQMKSNVRTKQGATSSNINTTKQKEIRSNQSLKSQPGTQKTKRTSEIRTSNMLRQNNLKQNCQTGEGSSTLKNSVPNQPHRKAQTTGGSVGQSKTVHKVALQSETMSKKIRSVSMDSEKDKSNGITLKKRPVNGDPQISRSVSIKCNIEVDGRINTNIDDRKDGMDVVSFTFTSPVKRSAPNPQPSIMEKIDNSAIDSFGSSHPYCNKFSSFHGLNIIGADALGALLEEKLRELANKVESTQCNMIRDDISVGSMSNFASTFNAVNTIPAAERSQFVIQKDNSDHLDNSNSLSTEDSSFIENQKWQDSADMEECSSSSTFSQAEKDQYRHPSPVSILEPSFESGSCSNTHADEVLSGFSASEYLEADGDIELSDSATSISTVDTGSEHLTRTFSIAESKDSTDWELDYVRVILNNAETMLKDFGLGKTSEFVAPQLFHELENQDNGMKQNEEDYSKLGRKVLFDCVSECLDLMSRHTFVGSSKSWTKLRTVFERKEWLAAKLWKEILGWKSMGDLMVEELVDNDMSTQYGNWLDFNVETFEHGVEIEKEILTCLVDELVSDIFVL